VSSNIELVEALSKINSSEGLSSIVININNEEREGLVRPSESPIEQKQIFKSRIK
jgi:hypothetical protein